MFIKHSAKTVLEVADRQQLAAEKKLLKAEVASLKRRAAEELAILRVVQKEHAQVKLGLTACTHNTRICIHCRNGTSFLGTCVRCTWK